MAYLKRIGRAYLIGSCSSIPRGEGQGRDLVCQSRDGLLRPTAVRSNSTQAALAAAHFEWCSRTHSRPRYLPTQSPPEFLTLGSHLDLGSLFPCRDNGLVRDQLALPSTMND